MTSTTLTPQREKRTLRSFIPIIDWLPKYSLSWLKHRRTRNYETD